MAYRAEFSINRIGESAISPSDRVSLLAEVRDCLIEEIQEGDSHAEVESDTVDEQAYAKVDEERGFIRHLGGRLYSKVRDYLEKQIGDSDSRTDVESDATDDHAYAQIYGERHFDDKLWRLNVRLYSNEDELRAEVFFGAALDDEVSSRPAPMFMRELVQRYDCRVGTHRLGFTILEEQDLEKFLFDPERKLPVLMVSRDSTGDLPYGGIEQLSDQFLGMAQVVEAPPEGRYTKEWGHQFDVLDGGAARIIWPDAKPRFMRYGEGGFYRHGRHDFVSEVLNDLENNASPESFNHEFVAVNVACMRFRNEQIRSRAQMDESSELKQLQRRTREAEREQERLERALAEEENKRVRAEYLLDTALRDLRELSRYSKVDGIARARQVARELRHERDAYILKLIERDSTVQKLNDEIQRYRQKDRVAGNEGNGFDSLIGDPTKNPGQLSLVGHGLNIMRDPVRKYIIVGLASEHEGREGIRSALHKAGVDPRQGVRLVSALDFSNFSNVISRNQSCFGKNAVKLSKKLEIIRKDRNLTIYPGFGEKAATQRSEALLINISQVLEIIGASEESQQVAELKNAL